jgi:uncharacterized membrane protein YiaA
MVRRRRLNMEDISDKMGRKFVVNAANSSRVLALVFMIVGIITAALDKTFGGFTPLCWFLLAIFWFIIVACTEVALLRLDTKK